MGDVAAMVAIGLQPLPPPLPLIQLVGMVKDRRFKPEVDLVPVYLIVPVITQGQGVGVAVTVGVSVCVAVFVFVDVTV